MKRCFHLNFHKTLSSACVVSASTLQADLPLPSVVQLTTFGITHADLKSLHFAWLFIYLVFSILLFDLHSQNWMCHAQD
jgi:hypothetical protein